MQQNVAHSTLTMTCFAHHDNCCGFIVASRCHTKAACCHTGAVRIVSILVLRLIMRHNNSTRLRILLRLIILSHYLFELFLACLIIQKFASTFIFLFRDLLRMPLSEILVFQKLPRLIQPGNLSLIYPDVVVFLSCRTIGHPSSLPVRVVKFDHLHIAFLETIGRRTFRLPMVIKEIFK